MTFMTDVFSMFMSPPPLYPPMYCTPTPPVVPQPPQQPPVEPQHTREEESDSDEN